MSPAATRRYSYDERIRRSQSIATVWPSAGEILRTYEQVTRFQQSLYALVERSRLAASTPPGRIPLEISVLPFLPQFQLLLRTVAESHPMQLAHAAEALESEGPAEWERKLQRRWVDADDGEEDEATFFLQAFLQPIAEYFAAEDAASHSNYSEPVCPYCGRKPVCGVLRQEGDGAKRSLICSFCTTEWEYRRIVCPACEQEQVERLPVYTAEDFAYIRVEACDACHSFIKTVDLTKNGHAIPLVDELGSLPLTLWAEERGYRKLQRNLLLM